MSKQILGARSSIYCVYAMGNPQCPHSLGLNNIFGALGRCRSLWRPKADPIFSRLPKKIWWVRLLTEYRLIFFGNLFFSRFHQSDCKFIEQNNSIRKSIRDSLAKIAKCVTTTHTHTQRFYEAMTRCRKWGVGYMSIESSAFRNYSSKVDVKEMNGFIRITSGKWEAFWWCSENNRIN